MEDWINANQSSLPQRELLRYSLLLYNQTSEFNISNKKRIATYIVSHLGDSDLWDKKKVETFMLSALNMYTPLEPDSTYLQTIKAFIRDFEFAAKERSSLYETMINAYNSKGVGPNLWYLESIQELVWDSKDLERKSEIVYAIVDKFEKPEKMHEAIQLIENILDSINADHSFSHRNEYQKYLQFVRALAYQKLSENSTENHYQAAEKQFRDLIENAPYYALNSTFNLIGRLFEKDRFSEAEILLTRIQKQNQNSPDLIFLRCLGLLIRQEVDSALSVVRPLKESNEAGPLYSMSMVELLTGKGDWEKTARRFLKTKHEYVPYIAIILYSMKAGSAKNEAFKILDRQWAKATPSTWSARAHQADPTVWREMLMGYFIGKVDRKEIFDVLDNKKLFDSSNLCYLSMSRKSMLCEAYFYEALVSRSRNDIPHTNFCLHKVIKEGNPAYFEYSMARYLQGALSK